MPSHRPSVLVTGGARGLGRTFSEQCARAGYAVAINYRSSAGAAQELVESIRRAGGEAVAVPGDVSVADEAHAVVEATVQAFGHIHAVINNAGIAEVRTAEEADEAHYDRMMDTNVKSAFLVSQAAVRHMRQRGQGGRLIFLSSLAAATGGVVSPAYAASKAALEGLMHYYATYLLPDHITANALAPALIESDMVNAMTLPQASALPLGRIGRADEMWPAIHMMLTVEYMTGQTVHLNAGRYMT
jgi:3-oxoacyl-[acyl-carrier protein] reductase